MSSNTLVNLTSLDFDTNKSSLSQYLQGQSRFAGYDFQGADLNVLLDVLAVNYFRYSFLLNLAVSEGFLDSAQLFDSVKSQAKSLNYTPASITSAQANVTVAFNATGESQPYIIPKGSTFSSQIKNRTLTFSTAETLSCASANQAFSFNTTIYEGIYLKDSYVFPAANVGFYPSFALSNPNSDITSLVVSVFGNTASVGVSYGRANSLLDLTSNSAVYFLQCSASNGSYEVLFGDGVFGLTPGPGSLVVLDYRTSQGPLANGAGAFSINFDPTGANELLGVPTVTTEVPSSGGSPAEDIETTRFRAPRWFQVQERCIVPQDYEIVLQGGFPEIQAVHAYGGETLQPPLYGKVVIAVQIQNVAGLPLSKVAQYAAFVKGRNPLSIQPIFVPANNMYLAVTTNVKYNINITTNTPPLMAAIVENAINTYNFNNLRDFDVTFEYSPFCDNIDAADPSIVSNLTDVSLYQKIYPTDNANNYYLPFSVPFLNDISQLPTNHANNLTKCLTSSNFYYKGNLSQLEDDGAGTIRIVNLQGSNVELVANCGTIDYTQGIVSLVNFAVDDYSGTSLNVYVEPESRDITTSQNIIMSIEPAQTTINITQVAQ